MDSCGQNRVLVIAIVLAAALFLQSAQPFGMGVEQPSNDTEI
jgi:hypothetical protein